MKPLTTTEIELCERILALESGRYGWPTVAKALAEPEIADWLIERSFKTPYTHLDGYMERFWLLNPYDLSAPRGERELPSARIHHILRADLDDVPHDHPWDARIVILQGWYVEERLMPDGSLQQFCRMPGDTAPLNFGEYHRIVEVSEGGVWTLFITYQYKGTWGFLVDGKKVPWREYLASPKPGCSGTPGIAAAAGA